MRPDRAGHRVGRSGRRQHRHPAEVRLMNEDLPPKARAAVAAPPKPLPRPRSAEHTSELQSLMRTSYAVFRLTTHTTSSPALPTSPRPDNTTSQTTQHPTESRTSTRL